MFCCSYLADLLVWNGCSTSWELPLSKAQKLLHNKALVAQPLHEGSGMSITLQRDAFSGSPGQYLEGKQAVTHFLICVCLPGSWRHLVALCRMMFKYWLYWVEINWLDMHLTENCYLILCVLGTRCIPPMDFFFFKCLLCVVRLPFFRHLHLTKQMLCRRITEMIVWVTVWCPLLPLCFSTSSYNLILALVHGSSWKFKTTISDESSDESWKTTET